MEETKHRTGLNTGLLFFLYAKFTYSFIEINGKYIKEDYIMLNIIIAGAFVFVLSMEANRLLTYGKENDLYVEGYLEK